MGNPMVHWELMVTDPQRSMSFYRSIFDWEFDESSFPGYPIIKTGAEPEGGMMAKPEGAPQCALNVYFVVDDADATIAKVTAAGGTIIAPKTKIEGVGWWAMFLDPDGIPVGILQSAM